MDEISYEGIDEAVLIHGLYHGTQPLGMGWLHNLDSLTLDQVREDFKRLVEADMKSIYFDYYRGRPLKTNIDTEKKTLTTRLYDRDAGSGAAQSVVDRLRAKAA